MEKNSTHAAPTAARDVPVDEFRWVSIRPIEDSDAPGLSDFYARLSAESRRRRFLGSTRGIEPRLIGDFVRPGEGVVGVLRERGPQDGAIVAHASVQRDSDGAAEVAFAVADELQGHGLGHALVAAALELARDRGIGRVSASLFADNVPMRRLLRGAGCDIIADVVDDGVEEIELRVAA